MLCAPDRDYVDMAVFPSYNYIFYKWEYGL